MPCAMRQNKKPAKLRIVERLGGYDVLRGVSIARVEGEIVLIKPAVVI